MAGPFGSGSGSSKGPFSSRPTSSGGSGLGGIFGFISHLGTDVKDAAFGIPAGLVNLAEHPVGSIKAMAKSTWHDWSPLFHGNFHQEWTQFLAHPLAPILDLGMVAGVVAAPFTGGASLDIAAEADLARAGIAIGDVGKMGDAISQSARIVSIPSKGKFLPGLSTSSKYIVRYHVPNAEAATTAGEHAIAFPAYVKGLSNNPLIQARQVALAKLGGRLSDGITSWTGRTALRTPLVPVKAEAAFERLVSSRKVTFEANKELTQAFADQALASAHKVLNEGGVDTSALNDFQVATHADIAQKVKAGHWLDAAPAKQWEGLLRWNHGQLVQHPIVTVDATGLKAALKQGLIGVKQDFPGMSGAKTFQEHLSAGGSTGKFGYLTKNPKLMAKDAAGKYKLVPTEGAFHFMQEGANSASFLRSLYRNPARVWKLTQVAWSPKTVLNTSVGNSFMLLMGQPRSFLYLMDGVRAMKGARAAGDLLRQTGEFKPGILAEHFGDVVHSSNAAYHAGISPVSDVGKTTSKVGKILRTGFYSGVHKVEQGLKSGSIIASLHAAPEVKAFMRDGKSFQDAAQAALQNNPMLRDNVARTALLHVGNYESFSKREQKIKNLVPFYSWDRHIVLHTIDMIATKPVRAAALATVGNQGSALTDKMLPGIPEYMRTNLPLAALGIASNKTLDTIGLNPYSSIADISGAALGATFGSRVGPNFAPSEDLAGQISPILTGIAQGISGHSILTDKALPDYGGPISTAAVSVFNNLPQVKLARLAAFGAPQGANPPLYADTFQRLLSKYGGVPIQQPNLARAQATEAKIEQGTHKKNKKKGPFG